MSVTQALDIMSQDLRAIDSDLRWAYWNGFQPRMASGSLGIRNGVPAGFDSSDPNGPDNVRGPKFDVSIANYRFRRAYERSVEYLAICEIRTAHAVRLICTSRVQPSLIKPLQNPTDLRLATKATRHALHRVRMLQTDMGRYSVEGRFQAAEREILSTRMRAPSAYECTSEMRRIFLSVFNAKTAEPTEPQLCRICDHRPLEEDSSNGRCNTCAQYFRRNGAERPKRLDRNVNLLADVQSAAQRRAQRGDGFGYN